MRHKGQVRAGSQASLRCRMRSLGRVSPVTQWCAPLRGLGAVAIAWLVLVPGGVEVDDGLYAVARVGVTVAADLGLRERQEWSAKVRGVGAQSRAVERQSF